MRNRLFLFTFFALGLLGLNGQAVAEDSDGDGLTDAFEITHGTDPEDWDSDGDTVTDLYDCAPLDPEESMPDDCYQIIVSHDPLPPPRHAQSDLVDPDEDFRDDAEPATSLFEDDLIARGGGGDASCAFIPGGADKGFDALGLLLLAHFPLIFLRATLKLRENSR